MIVSFGDISTKDGFLPTESSQGMLKIEWNGNLEQLYTLIFYDMDAPYPAPKNTNSPYLHYLVTNIKGSDMASGNQLIDYLPPNPPKDSLPHTYFVDIYSQTDNIRPIQHSQRKFGLNEFVKNNKLKLFDRVSFKIGNKILTPVSANKYKPTTTNYFKADTSLNEKQQDWCRCVLKVAAKQRGDCNIEKAWFETRDGQQCYNPYAICSKSVGTSVRTCGENYDFSSISDNELIAYTQLHQTKTPKIEIPDPYDRDIMLNNIKRWKELK